MFEFLSKEVREGLEAARKRDRKRQARLRAHIGGSVYPILRLWDDGFALSGDSAVDHLRGTVDVFDGANHILQGLIVASSSEQGEVICDIKRVNPVSDRPPLDYWRDVNAPVALLPKA